jgi:hypothetical protein
MEGKQELDYLENFNLFTKSQKMIYKKLLLSESF